MYKQNHYDIKPWYRLLAPRYWATWLFFGLLRVLALLPYSLLLKIGKGLGYVIMRVLPKRKKITEINLRLCFPALSEAARQKLCLDSFISNGIGICELALAWYASDKRLKKMLTIVGRENLENALAQKKGILLTTCHFTSIELGIRLISLVTPIKIIYRPQDNDCFESLLQKRRARYVKECIYRRNMHGLMRALKSAETPICYTPDQDMGKDGAVFAPFFGIQANTVVGTNYLVKRTGAILVPGFYYRDEKNKQYRLECLPTLTEFPSGDDVADATRINKIIETAILKQPEQYMWQHRRFKTRPEGQASMYDI